MRRFLPVLLLLSAACVPAPAKRPPLMGSAYQLVDVEKLAAASPGAFELPAPERRRSCKVGDQAKIIMEVTPGAPPREYTGERPWLNIIEVREGPRYLGRLANELVVFTEIDANAPIDFGPEHIIELITK